MIVNRMFVNRDFQMNVLVVYEYTLKHILRLLCDN